MGGATPGALVAKEERGPKIPGARKRSAGKAAPKGRLGALWGPRPRVPRAQARRGGAEGGDPGPASGRGLKKLM